MARPFSKLNLAVISACVFLISSCKKENYSAGLITSENAELSTTVKDWFGKIKDAGEIYISNRKDTKVRANSSGGGEAVVNPIRLTLQNLDILEENLYYNKAVYGKKNSKYSFAVIPINDAIKAKKGVSAEASLNLVLTIDKTGKLISGNIICFFPSDKKFRINFSPRIVADVLEGRNITEEGTFKMLSLTGRWKGQFEVKNKEIISTGVIKAKSDSTGKKTNTLCVDWYLVTNYHYADGTTITNSTYVGTSCDDCNGGNYFYLCDAAEGGDGSGGSSYSAPEIQTEIVEENETVSGGGSGPSGSSIFDGSPSVKVRYSWKEYAAWDYYGLVRELYYVDIFDATLPTSTFYYISTGGLNCFMYVSLSGQLKSSTPSGTGFLLHWEYNLDAGVQALSGENDYSSERRYRSRYVW